jgi:N-acetylgalactosamine kinase
MHADLPEACQRYTNIAADFEARYQMPAVLFARAPGRVNIIGEHIDYSGYGVLPMALSLDTVVAISLAGTTIDVSNLDGETYPAYTFVLDPSQLVDTEHHVWANYALAAYKGVHDYLDGNPQRHNSLSKSLPGIKVRLPCWTAILEAGKGSVGMCVTRPIIYW